MKKAKAPGYQRYPKDFLADTALMTAEQVGAYQLMLDYAWIGLPGFKQGQLPADDESLAKLTRVTTEHWKEIKNIIINCFIFVPGSNEKSPYFEHKRIKRDLLKQRNYRKQQSKKGKLSAEKRWGEGNRGYPPVTPSVQPKSKSSSSSATAEKRERARAPDPAGQNGKYPVWLMNDPAVIAYWEHFHPEDGLPGPIQAAIAREIKDLRVWNKILDYWQLSRYRPESVPKMLEKYREDVGKPTGERKAVIPG